MNKKILIIISILLIVILALVTIFIIDHNRMKNNEPVIFSTWGENYNSKKENNITENMNVVLSLEDEISENSVWCGTFNLIWNDLKNNLAKQDIIFTPQIKLVENLNKGTFTKEYLSEESYYTVYDKASLELKEKIEKDIKEKFNETSDILNDFDWENFRSEDYFLYAMLKKEFEFPKEFTQLENGNFGEFKNVEFFGVNNTTENEVKEQIEVLYYNTKDDFAIKLLTKNNDEIIITKGSNEKTFGEMYSEIIKKSENYEGSKSFGENDTLKIPNISFNIKKEFKELENQIFEFSTGDNYYIEKALQTIQFELNKKGGKLKSEAGMMVNRSSIVIEEPRQFLVDSEFAIFLKEKDKNLPYFASTISDISCIQENVEKEEINLKKEDSLNELKNVSLSIKPNTLTNTSATIIIEDTNEQHYAYGEWFRIDKKENGNWKALEPINKEYCFNDIAWIIGEDNKLEDFVDWSDLYGELKSGEYRLVKEIYDEGYKYFPVEFVI